MIATFPEPDKDMIQHKMLRLYNKKKRVKKRKNGSGRLVVSSHSPGKFRSKRKSKCASCVLLHQRSELLYKSSGMGEKKRIKKKNISAGLRPCRAVYNLSPSQLREANSRKISRCWDESRSFPPAPSPLSYSASLTQSRHSTSIRQRSPVCMPTQQ